MIWEAIGGITLVILLLTAAMWAFYRAGRETGYEEGRADAYTEVRAADHAQQLAEARSRSGRHARTEPRQQPASPPASDQRPPWYTEIPGPVQLPRGGAIAVMVARHSAAPGQPAAIDTVLLTPEAAPAKNGAPDTGTMPRVTDTGSIPAITDQFIADLEAREAAHRKEQAEQGELV